MNRRKKKKKKKEKTNARKRGRERERGMHTNRFLGCLCCSVRGEIDWMDGWDECDLINVA